MAQEKLAILPSSEVRIGSGPLHEAAFSFDTHSVLISFIISILHFAFYLLHLYTGGWTFTVQGEKYGLKGKTDTNCTNLPRIRCQVGPLYRADNRTRTSKSLSAARVSSLGNSGSWLASWAVCNSPRSRWYSDS